MWQLVFVGLFPTLNLFEQRLHFSYIASSPRANLSHAPGWHIGCLLVLWTSLQSRLTFSTTQMLSRSTSSTVQRIHPFQYSRDPTRQASQGNCSSQLTLSTDELVDGVRGLSALEPSYLPPRH